MAQETLVDRRVKEETIIYQFLIVFNLPKWVDKYVVQLKGEFANEFGSFPSRKAKPHITIAQFPYWIQDQDTILLMLQNELYRFKPIQIDLNGYDVFSWNNKVVYIHVDQSDDLQRLRAPFSHIQQLFGYKSDEFFIFDKPHVTIARGLRVDVFEEAKKSTYPDVIKVHS